MMKKILDIVKPGVISGDDVTQLFEHAKSNEFAIPAVNVTTSNTINAALEAASRVNSPIIVQISNGGAVFFPGKGIKLNGHASAILGGLSAAKYINTVAQYYGVPVILHTDHAAKKLLP